MLVTEAEQEVAWRLISAPRPVGTPKLRVVDVGTGSGAIAIALAVALRKRRMLPEVSIVAFDCSPDALWILPARTRSGTPWRTKSSSRSRTCCRRPNRRST